MGPSEIVEFYKDQTIFLTGGSGFVGKILIEKLLKECPDVRRIYVLLRPKKNKTPEERFSDLFSFACFDGIKAKNCEILKKVFLINGDILDDNLGLSEEDLQVLVKETTIVIHAAANVKFEQSLKEAVGNVKGTRDLLELAKKMHNLKVLVYISTAYSNCLRSEIKEEFYKPPISSENLFTLVSKVTDEELIKITPKLLGPWPNPYIYAKCVSEDLVRRHGEELPITVVRPAIIIGAIKEPIPGWIDNIYGVVGIVLGAALGVIRSLHAKLDAKANLVPVDYVANCILAAVWKRSTSSSTIIYNYTGDERSQLTWKGFMDIIEPKCWEASSPKILWYYCFKLRENETWHKICIFFLHTVQAYVVDFFLFCARKPTLAVKNYNRLNSMLELIGYFSTKSWDFRYGNVRALCDDLSEVDKKMFAFDMVVVNWPLFARNAVFGARKFLLKDSIETMPAGRRKIKLMFFLHYGVVVFWWFLIYKIVAFVFGLIF